MDESKRFFIHTLGCKVNQYESQALREAWTACGLRETSTPEQADILLVNTCAVTAGALRDVRHSLRKLARDNPSAHILAVGCAADILAQNTASLPEHIRLLPHPAKSGALNPFSIGEEPVHGYQDFSISDYFRARAVVKVQDGCSHRCTYCIVPLTRGPSTSRPFAEITAEVERLYAAGFREIGIGGINLRHYGRGLAEDMDFWDLVLGLIRHCRAAGLHDIAFRLSSLDPAQLTGKYRDKALQAFASGRIIRPHLHISLQSASEKVLKAMNRSHYGPRDILDFLDLMRKDLPSFGLGADILVGFPGEDDSDFADTLDFIHAAGLTYGHVFPYSRRPGTPAARLREEVPHAEKKERAAKARELVAGQKQDFIRSLARRPTLEMIPEDRAPLRGMCEYYVECRLEHATPADIELKRPLTVVPAAAEAERLRVRPADSPDSPHGKAASENP